MFYVLCLNDRVAKTQGTRQETSESQHPFDALLLTFKQCGFFLEAALFGTALMKELVIVVGSPPGDLPGPRDLESLGRRLVCLQLWHFASYFLFEVLAQGP